MEAPRFAGDSCNSLTLVLHVSVLIHTILIYFCIDDSKTNPTEKSSYINTTGLSVMESALNQEKNKTEKYCCS